MNPPEPSFWELAGNAAVTLTTIAANLTVVVGGIYAGRKVIQRLTALVRVSSAQVVDAASDAAPPASSFDQWSFERSRVIFTTAIEAEAAGPFAAGMGTVSV